MARIRSIKPDFFMHDGLAELSPIHRLLFIGLWTQADREGRLEDRPARIKAAVLPYDAADVDQMIDDLALHPERFIVRYEVCGVRYLQVTGFSAHQQPHIREVPSKIPGLPASTVPAPCRPRSPESGQDGTAPGQHLRRGGEQKGAGREQEGSRAEEGALDARGAAATDPVSDLSPDLAEAVALCLDHPYLGDMLDPAVTLAELRSGYPNLPLVATVRQARAALTPERIAEQRGKQGRASRFLVAFFGYAERDRVRDATAASKGPGATDGKTDFQRADEAEDRERRWREQDLAEMRAEAEAATAAKEAS